jgi:hypothetical protein
MVRYRLVAWSEELALAKTRTLGKCGSGRLSIGRTAPCCRAFHRLLDGAVGNRLRRRQGILQAPQRMHADKGEVVGTPLLIGNGGMTGRHYYAGLALRLR